MNSTPTISDLTRNLSLVHPELDLPSHSGQYAYIITKPDSSKADSSANAFSRFFNSFRKPQIEPPEKRRTRSREIHLHCKNIDATRDVHFPSQKTFTR